MKKEIIIGVSIILAVLIYVGSGIYKQRVTNKREGLLFKGRYECIKQAKINNSERQKSHCNSLGLGDSCMIDLNVLAEYRKSLNDEIDNCIQLWK